MSDPVGIVGLGLMGNVLARRLIAAWLYGGRVRYRGGQE